MSAILELQFELPLAKWSFYNSSKTQSGHSGEKNKAKNIFRRLIQNQFIKLSTLEKIGEV